MKKKDLISTIVFTVVLLFLFPIIKGIVTLLMLSDSSLKLEYLQQYSLPGTISALISSLLAVPLGLIVGRRAWLFSGMGAATVALSFAVGAPIMVRHMWMDFIALIVCSVMWSIAGYRLKSSQ